ncbi:LuxR C-terminal-related transcriptional regulator [Anaerofustis sp. HA2171]|uniref:LuxR C-terminal-related transcriptional regulator n=1 Tax=Anaerofustis butyriciformans TaxID=3108533 RepID=UPI002E2FBDB8|nr:LuxR C-terminal-related transcriptional regulator [Anaerofustis sp. HA2171]
MKYLTVKEVAQNWNVSIRVVQRYCLEGKIEGAKKVSNVWQIPQNASNPINNGRTKQEVIDTSNLMPLLNTPFKPGECLKYINNIKKGDSRDIALCEYYYFSGQAEKAAKMAELYLTSSDLSLSLSAYFIYSYANLSLGNITQAKYALSILKKTASSKKDIPLLKDASAFIATAAAILLHLPLPNEIPPMKEYINFLPEGLRMFALYVHAHYRYLQGEYERSIGIVETAIALQKETYPISSIYLHLVAVMDYMSIKNVKKAQKHLLIAWDLARPDDLIEAFGEHHGLLGGMLESVIKKDWPDDFKRIIDITYRFSEGWRKVHNPITGRDVADNLTTTEFAAAMLAARGWTNQEIGEHMNISANTVKQYMSSAFQKLGINQRQDLKKYMLD